jgi:hypothetical protein
MPQSYLDASTIIDVEAAKELNMSESTRVLASFFSSGAGSNDRPCTAPM